MKQTLVRGLLVAGLFACGGARDTTEVTLPDPGRPYTLEEVYPQADDVSSEQGDSAPAEPVVTGEMKLIDRLSFGRETVGFWATSEDSVMLEFDANPGDPEIQNLLEQEAGEPITAAELWLSMTGLEPSELPSELALDHANVALSSRSDDDYRRLPRPEIDKALSLATLFAITPGAPSGLTCTDHSFLQTVTLSNPSFAKRFLCSSSHPDTEAFYSVQTADSLDITAQPRACDSSAILNNNFNSRRMQVAFYVQDPSFSGGFVTSVSSKFCAGRTKNEWVCTTSLAAITSGHYKFLQLNSAGVGFERMALEADMTNPLATRNFPVVTFGAGMEKRELPQFGGPFCLGDSVPVAP